jgi:hypothetical protein
MARLTSKPTPGWNLDGTTVVNPKPPAVPATLHINLAQYYAACALIGLTSSQQKEPNKEWAANWAIHMGAIMARKAKRRLG